MKYKFVCALHISKTLRMSKALSYKIGSDSSEEAQPSLKHLAKELKSRKVWQKQETLLKEKERAEREQYLATLEEKFRILNEKQEKLQEEIRQSRRSKKSSKTPTQIIQFKDDSRIANLQHLECIEGSVKERMHQEILGLTFFIPMGNKMLWHT